MKIEGELKDGLDLALNEACLLAFEYDNVLNKVTVIFETVTINTDNKVVFHFLGVSRCSARLLMGRWDDENADVLKMTPDQLSAQLEDYNGDSMYGWEFINIEDSKEKFEEWKDKLSFDVIISQESESTNCIDIFSEQFIGSPKTLDLRICFEEIQIETLSGIPLSIQEFINRGTEGWNAIYSGNEEVTNKYGIIPVEPLTKQKTTPVHSTIWMRLRNWFIK